MSVELPPPDEIMELADKLAQNSWSQCMYDEGYATNMLGHELKAEASEIRARMIGAVAAHARAAVDAALEAAAVKCEQRANMKAYDLIGEARARYEQDQITATRLAAAIRAMRSGVEHI